MFLPAYPVEINKHCSYGWFSSITTKNISERGNFLQSVSENLLPQRVHPKLSAKVDASAKSPCYSDKKRKGLDELNKPIYIPTKSENVDKQWKLY